MKTARRSIALLLVALAIHAQQPPPQATPTPPPPPPPTRSALVARHRKIEEKIDAAEQAWATTAGQIAQKTAALERQYDAEHIRPRQAILADINAGFMDPEEMRKMADLLVAHKRRELTRERDLLLAPANLPAIVQILCGKGFTDDTLRQSELFRRFRAQLATPEARQALALGDFALLRDFNPPIQWDTPAAAPDLTPEELLGRFQQDLQKTADAQSEELRRQAEADAARFYPVCKIGDPITLHLKAGHRPSRYSNETIFSVTDEPLRKITPQSIQVGKYTIPRDLLHEADLQRLYEKENREAREAYVARRLVASRPAVPSLDAPELRPHLSQLLLSHGYIPNYHWTPPATPSEPTGAAPEEAAWSPARPECWFARQQLFQEVQRALQNWCYGPAFEEQLVGALQNEGLRLVRHPGPPPRQEWITAEEARRRHLVAACEDALRAGKVPVQRPDGSMDWISGGEYRARRTAWIRATLNQEYVLYNAYRSTRQEFITREELAVREALENELAAWEAECRAYRWWQCETALEPASPAYTKVETSYLTIFYQDRRNNEIPPLKLSIYPSNAASRAALLKFQEYARKFRETKNAKYARMARQEALGLQGAGWTSLLDLTCATDTYRISHLKPGKYILLAFRSDTRPVVWMMEVDKADDGELNLPLPPNGMLNLQPAQ